MINENTNPADREEDAANNNAGNSSDSGGQGDGGATHNDFGKDSGIRPEPGKGGDGHDPASPANN